MPVYPMCHAPSTFRCPTDHQHDQKRKSDFLDTREGERDEMAKKIGRKKREKEREGKMREGGREGGRVGGGGCVPSVVGVAWRCQDSL